jgi:hypothetical protein
VTDAFYRRGAVFNKGLALEEGFDAMGREGWIMVLDADILLPRHVDWSFRRFGNLYTPRRSIFANPRHYNDAMDWSAYPTTREQEFCGYCQLFHADDPRLALRPWYGIDWPHAGGCDIDFECKWPKSHKLRPGFNVLHLGQDNRNWCGRTTDRLDRQPIVHRQERDQMMRQLMRDGVFRMMKIPKEAKED